jgi:uncharacterized protein (TIGR02996 family)
MNEIVLRVPNDVQPYLHDVISRAPYKIPISEASGHVVYHIPIGPGSLLPCFRLAGLLEYHATDKLAREACLFFREAAAFLRGRLGLPVVPTPDEMPFLSSIREDPSSLVNWMAYADYLSEHLDPARSEAIRSWL